MDYDGNSFQSRWRKGQLKIRAMQMEDNTLGLLKIVLDAAVSNGQFKMCWDLREFKNRLYPSGSPFYPLSTRTRQCWISTRINLDCLYPRAYNGS